MDILFVFAAVCPALAAAWLDSRKQELSWQAWAGRSAGWFYASTFGNLLLLYLNGWGSFDFTALTVQFVLRYMFTSAVIIAAVKLGVWAVQHTKEGGRDV